MTASGVVAGEAIQTANYSSAVYLRSIPSYEILSQEWIEQQEQLDIEQAKEREAKAKAEAEALKQALLVKQSKINTERLEAQVDQLKKYVGKTWYVFSGSTPRGWDCSGLVMWFYGELGVELPHSANKQAWLGEKVTEPRIGDIIAFTHSGKHFFHTAIYIGDGKLIHAGYKKGRSTEILTLEEASANGVDLRFVRILPNS
jgi:cell wall-associated NlpC family hydrolase